MRRPGVRGLRETTRRHNHIRRKRRRSCDTVAHNADSWKGSWTRISVQLSRTRSECTTGLASFVETVAAVAEAAPAIPVQRAARAILVRKVEETIRIQAVEDAVGVVVVVTMDKIVRAVVAAVEPRAHMNGMTARSGYCMIAATLLRLSILTFRRI